MGSLCGLYNAAGIVALSQQRLCLYSLSYFIRAMKVDEMGKLYSRHLDDTSKNELKGNIIWKTNACMGV